MGNKNKRLIVEKVSLIRIKHLLVSNCHRGMLIKVLLEKKEKKTSKKNMFFD